MRSRSTSFPVGPNKGGQIKGKKLEGKLTMFYVANPKGRSALEVFRNYEAAFKQAGFEPLFACRGPECGDQRGIKGLHYLPYNDDARYLAARRSSAQGEVHIGMHVQPLNTYFVVIEGKPLDTGLAKVSSAEALGKDIMSTGQSRCTTFCLTLVARISNRNPNQRCNKSRRFLARTRR